MATPAVSWSAPEFEYYPKTPGWYWTSIIIATLLLAAAVWQKNFLFGLFILVAEVLILVWSGREPETVVFALDDRALLLPEGKRHLFSDMAHWSVQDIPSDEWDLLVVAFHRSLRPTIHVLFPVSRIDEIRSHLGARVVETEPDPSVIDTLERLLGF